ncbi:MAG TPA: oligosaccharide flippase family protein [Gemmatimonadales bacterium]|nr:oligosaccharide flippase family protein [Gemmatimonadales bacterium]
MSQIRALGKHTLIYAVGILIGKAASFIMLPIYTRYLTPADYGVLELLQMTIDVVGMLAGLGIASSVFKFYSDETAPEAKAEVISTSSTALATLSLGTAIVGFLWTPQITRLVLGAGQPVLYFHLFFIVYFVQTFTTIPYLFIRAEQRSVMFVTLSVVRLIIALSLNILFVVYLRMGVRGVLFSTLIAWSTVGGYLVAYTYRRVGLHFSLPRIKRIARFSAPLVLSSLASFVLTFSDRYFLKYYSNNATVGIYSLAYQFGFALAYFAWTPFSQIWDPQRYQIARQPDGQVVFRRVFFYLNLVLLSLACVIAVTAHDILRVMAGYAFQSAAGIVPILMLPYILQSWSSYCDLGLFLEHRTRWLGGVAVIAAASNIALNVLLIPRYGAYGAAWATAGAFFVRFILVYPLSQRLYPVRLGWGRVAALGAVLMLAFVGRQFLPVTHIVPSVAASALVLIATGLAIYFGVLRDSERQAAKEFALRPLALLRAVA